MLALVVISGACTRSHEVLAPRQREIIQARVTNWFNHSVLFKPTETESNSAPALRLAPLIIQEMGDTNAGSRWRDQFDSEDSQPLVQSEFGFTVLDGRLHDQFSCRWSYVSSEPSTNSVRKWQGVRLTLNAAGEPVIWEVLEDSSGADIIYVAQSLELAARTQFGPPLTGRKFSIERSLLDAPQTVVANVIDDGPTPMGPVVYLNQQSRDVTTLICRCMASQGGTLLRQTNYELLLTAPSNGWPSTFPLTPLEQRLRLPRSF